MSAKRRRTTRRTRKKKNSPPFFNPKSILLALLVGGAVYGYDNINLERLIERIEGLQTEWCKRRNVNAQWEEVSDLEIPILHSRSGGQIIQKKGFTLSYNADYKTPQWVAWQLTAEKVVGQEGRTDKFLPDPDILGAKAYTKDYSNSGYDRGHMAPAGDMKWCPMAMEESFYLSNICPQNPNLNRGDWKDLEEKSREWASRYGAIYIACGPIYDKPNPKRIGNNKVGVPDAFYKVVLLNYPTNPKAIGFIFDNKAGHKALEKYIVTIDSVESRTHIDFFSALPDDLENRIETEIHYLLP